MPQAHNEKRGVVPRTINKGCAICRQEKLELELP